MTLYLVEGPSVPVMTLAQAKEHLRVEQSETVEDELITALVAAATGKLDGRDGVLQRALMAQTWDMKLDCFPWWDPRQNYSSPNWGYVWSGCIKIPLPPLISVESIKYIDVDGVEQTYSSSSYHVAGVGGGQHSRVELRSGSSWPSVAARWPEPVTIRFVAGYVDTSMSPPAGEVPAPIVQAIKLIMGHHYANRETVVIGTTAISVPQSADWLLEGYKVFV